MASAASVRAVTTMMMMPRASTSGRRSAVVRGRAGGDRDADHHYDAGTITTSTQIHRRRRRLERRVIVTEAKKGADGVAMTSSASWDDQSESRARLGESTEGVGGHHHHHHHEGKGSRARRGGRVQASGGQFAPPGDVVSKSVGSLDEEETFELEIEASAERAAERSAAIESTFLDDFVDVLCEDGDVRCELERMSAREVLWERWSAMNAGVSKRTKGLALFGALMAGFGVNITLIKIAQQEMSADLFALLRFVVGSLVFAPFLKPVLKDSRIIRGGFELGLWVSLGYYFQNAGVEFTDAARASFISSFTIICVPIIAGMSGRAVRPLTWIATGIAIAGLGMMENIFTVPGLVDPAQTTAVADAIAGDAPASLRGDLYTLASALIFAIHIFRTDCIFNGVNLKHKESMGLVCIQMLTVVVVFSGLLVKDYLACDCDFTSIAGEPFSEMPWGLIGFVGAVTTAGCVYLETVALTLLESQEATLMYSTEPVWGAVFAYLLLGETLSPSATAGAVLILASTVVGSLGVDDEDSILDTDVPTPTPTLEKKGDAAAR